MNDGKSGHEKEQEHFNTSVDESSHDEYTTDNYKSDLKKGNNNILVRFAMTDLQVGVRC